MSTQRITAIEEQQRDSNRVSIFLDGVFAIGIFADVAVALGLRVGQEITRERLAEIAERETERKALEDAYASLSYRARSEKEIVDKLHRKGYTDEVIALTLERLRAHNFVNDSEFAAQWTRHRQATKGSRFIAQELRQKGVAADIVSETLEAAVDPDSEQETAWNLVVRRVGTAPADTSRAAQAKLAAFLQRRGFGWDTIRPILTRLYRDSSGEEYPETQEPDEPNFVRRDV